MLKSSTVKNSDFVSSSKWNRQSQKDDSEESAFVRLGGEGEGNAMSKSRGVKGLRGSEQGKVCIW